MSVTTSIPNRAIFGRLLDHFRNRRAARAKRERFHQTRRELAQLSDHALADIGITRQRIERIAKKLTFGR